MRLYIEVGDNIDEAAARAKAAGVTLASEPHDTEWGSRAFEVQEPSGFMLTIASTPTLVGWVPRNEPGSGQRRRRDGPRE